MKMFIWEVIGEQRWGELIMVKCIMKLLQEAAGIEVGY